jgi:hypothetical protein
VQPEASLLLLNFVSEEPGKSQSQKTVLEEVKSLRAWVEGWAGIKDKDDRIRIYSSSLTNVIHCLMKCFETHLEDGEDLIRSVCSVLPISKPECEAAVLGFIWMFLKISKSSAPPPVLESVDILVESLNSPDPAVLKLATLILSRVLGHSSLQRREDLWAKVNPVSVVDHLSDPDAEVRGASVELFAILADKP